MEDLSDILKRNFSDLYKKKTETFGTVKDRVVKMNDQRKTTRHDKMLEKRKIPENMSPVVTPVPKRERTLQKPQEQEVNPRLEMLAKWKADKEKRKQAQKNSKKPLFKVTHIPISVGLPNLESVNSEIKGKPFKSKFAPPNHQFKPPANIKPINFNNSVKSIGKREKSNVQAPRHQMLTRSQAKTSTNDTIKCQQKTKTVKNGTKLKQKKTETSHKTTNQSTSNVIVKETNKSKESSESPLMSPDFPVQNSLNSSTSSDLKTPKKTEPPAYVSPFVTISRGKDSARKEFEARKSRKSFSSTKKDTENCTSPKAGAAYFTWLLNNQITRLQGMCDQWTQYKDENNPPEEAVSMIDVAIGQTNLLLTKKFMQFRGLIHKCEDPDTQESVTCEDLHGFWDMIHLQVDNLDKRFENLDHLRDNNWQEILPEVKKVVKKKAKPLKNAKASAGLKEAIQAARRRKLETNDSEIKSSILKTPQSRRSSIRLTTVKTEEKNKHRNSSPGLMMMKIAQRAKSFETPGKSILKADAHKSAKSQSKTVLFQDELDSSPLNSENDVNKTNVQIKAKTPTRKSMRLAKAVLF